jgi:hypothetical protein
VETVLESSVQRLDQQIKIIAVLYDARTGQRLWGAAYNREMRNLFAIQTNVAENLASALQVRLSPNERDEIQQKPTDNVTAYDLFLQGRAYYLLRHKDDNEKASALDLRVACAERASDWSFAIRATEAKADTDALAQFHLALAYHFSGDPTRASAEATKLQTSAKSLLTIHSTDRGGMYYLAVSDRILGLRDEANELLRKLFPESISVLPQSLTLFRDDPSLDVFKQDSSYQELVASYDKKDAETRARIAEIEKSSPQ